PDEQFTPLMGGGIGAPQSKHSFFANKPLKGLSTATDGCIEENKIPRSATVAHNIERIIRRDKVVDRRFVRNKQRRDYEHRFLRRRWLLRVRRDQHTTRLIQ